MPCIPSGVACIRMSTLNTSALSCRAVPNIQYTLETNIHSNKTNPIKR
jgi:hypothetical protein